MCMVLILSMRDCASCSLLKKWQVYQKHMVFFRKVIRKITSNYFPLKITNHYSFTEEREEKLDKTKVKIGYPIFADLPTYLYPIISDFCKPTYLPNHRISYVDGP